MGNLSLNKNKQNYFKNSIFKQQFKIHSLNIGDYKMKNLLSLFIIVSFCLLGFSALADETTKVVEGGTEIEVGDASPVILELENATGETIKDVWVRVMKGDNTKITKMNLFKIGEAVDNLDDKVDDNMDGIHQPEEDDNDFPAGGVTQGRTILGEDEIPNSKKVKFRKFKLVIHFANMDTAVKIKVMLSEKDITGYHHEVCMDTPLNDGSGELTVPAGNDLCSTDLLNNGASLITSIAVACPQGLYAFEDLSFKSPFENSVVSLQNEIAIIELHPYLQPQDSATMFFRLSNAVDIDTQLEFTFEESSNFIPTLSEWGVIILLLLVLAVGMVFLYQRQTSLAVAGVAVSQTMGAKPKLFDRKLFAKVFAVVLMIGVAGLVAAYLYFGQITSADPFGVFVSAAVVAYMVQLWMMRKEDGR